MNTLRRQSGITIVELLVVMAVLGLILGVLAAFFSSQTRVTSRTQARNEVEVKLRTSAEIMLQDLQIAGSRIVVGSSGAKNIVLPCNPLEGSEDHCVLTDEGSSILTLFYATSLRPGHECRRVDYSVEDRILNRSDVPCGDAVSFQEFASEINTPVIISFQCENGSQNANPADCYGAGSFPQQASITLSGSSENKRENHEAAISLTATMPNLRPVTVSKPTVGGE
jgi:type II secretory pathway pseudopilin PulG